MDGTDVIGSFTFTIEDDDKALPTTADKGPNTTATGKNFYAWYSDAAFAGATAITIPGGSTGDKVFYARFADTYKITYSYGDFFAENANPDVVINGTTLNLVNPTMSQGTFLGWYKDASFTQPIAEIPADQAEDITLYAKCQYTITYHLNGGTGLTASAPLTYIGGEKNIVLSSFKATRDGYTHKGWCADEALTSSLARIAKTTFGDLDLYEKWEATSYTIKFNNATVIDFTGKYTVESGEIILPTNPTPDADHADLGSFYGWYDNADFTGDPITSIPAGSTGNKTFYARFVHSYNITYAYGDSFAENANPVLGIKGDVITLVAPVMSEGTFLGWYKDDKFTQEVTEISADQAEDITLYAKCQYTITYYLDDGTLKEGTPVTFIGGDKNIVISTYKPTKEGYTFGGWYTDEEFSSSAVTRIAKNTYENVVLYAKWTEA